MTQTRFKKVPFDLELAKKITNKEVNGRIVTEDGLNARIVCFDLKHYGSKNNIIALIDCGDYELAPKYDPNGKVQVMQDKYDLHLEVPTYYRDYSNFVPCKWQSCLVRDSISDRWIVRVCKGIDAYGEPFFFPDGSNKDCSLRWVHALPFSKITERLFGTTKSYEELIQELDAELTATTKNEQQ